MCVPFARRLCSQLVSWPNQFLSKEACSDKRLRNLRRPHGPLHSVPLINLPPFLTRDRRHLATPVMGTGQPWRGLCPGQTSCKSLTRRSDARNAASAFVAAHGAKCAKSDIVLTAEVVLQTLRAMSCLRVTCLQRIAQCSTPGVVMRVILSPSTRLIGGPDAGHVMHGSMTQSPASGYVMTAIIANSAA